MYALIFRIIARLLLLALLGMALAGCSLTTLSEAEAEEKWATSAHADVDSRSFTRWNDDDPAVIPERCAKCHSTPGYLDYLGVDGATPGQVDHPVPVGTTIECEACHNDIAENKSTVIMPSGVEIEELSQESNCMECHQGRASAVQVTETIAGLEPDTVDPELSLPNVHNNAAAATFYGGQAMGGGEFPQQAYLGKFYHGFDNCATCHDAHTLETRVDNCRACHLGATTIEGVREIRLRKTDYDGDGDTAEGLSGEIETMQEKLLITMQIYSGRTEDTELLHYDGGFVDDAGESYSTWTPRLLQSAYNYQYVAKDPGSYAHNPRYIMQLLFDSIDDLGGSTRGMTRPSDSD